MRFQDLEKVAQRKLRLCDKLIAVTGELEKALLLKKMKMTLEAQQYLKQWLNWDAKKCKEFSSYCYLDILYYQEKFPDSQRQAFIDWVNDRAN